MSEPVFTEAMLRRATSRWWQVRRRLRARRFWREVRANLEEERYQFMGRREDLLAWDDYPVVRFPLVTSVTDWSNTGEVTWEDDAQ